MAFRTLQLRRDTGANWTSADPVLAAGEMGVELDTGKFKLGDGVAVWSALGYASALPAEMAEIAQDAIGAMIADTNSIGLTYVDGTPVLKADLKISASPGIVTLTIEPDGLKADIDSIDLGSAS